MISGVNNFNFYSQKSRETEHRASHLLQKVGPQSTNGSTHMSGYNGSAERESDNDNAKQ